MNDMAQHPSPLPGSNARTDSLTFIPTLDERKQDKKSKKEKDDSENSGSRKPSWGWFKGSDEKDKKEKKKEDDHKDGKRAKAKAARAYYLTGIASTISYKKRERRRVLARLVERSKRKKTVCSRHFLVAVKRKATGTTAARRVPLCDHFLQIHHTGN